VPTALFPKKLNVDELRLVLQAQFGDFLKCPTEPFATSVLACVRDLCARDPTRLNGVQTIMSRPQLVHVKNGYMLEAAVLRKLNPELTPAHQGALILNTAYCNEMMGMPSAPGEDAPAGCVELLMNHDAHQPFMDLCGNRAKSFSTTFCWLFETQAQALALGLAFVSPAPRPARAGRLADPSSPVVSARRPRHGRGDLPAPGHEQGADFASACGPLPVTHAPLYSGHRRAQELADRGVHAA
jgi:hypothetical protein